MFTDIRFIAKSVHIPPSPNWIQARLDTNIAGAGDDFAPRRVRLLRHRISPSTERALFRRVSVTRRSIGGDTIRSHDDELPIARNVTAVKLTHANREPGFRLGRVELHHLISEMNSASLSALIIPSFKLREYAIFIHSFVRTNTFEDVQQTKNCRQCDWKQMYFISNVGFNLCRV